MKVKYFDLENKRVFITGGGSGIGASIVEHFCEQGSEVYFVDINVEESKKLIDKIKKLNFKIPNFIKCNLLNIKQLQEVIRKIIIENGNIDILVNNGANDQRHEIDEVTEEYWDNRMTSNLKHYFFTIQSVKNSMIKNKNGSIINLSSLSWMMGVGGMPAYTTAKSGILGLTRSVARDLGTYNIRVNSVMPGSVSTERQLKEILTPEYKKFVLSRQCLRRELKPEDVARVVLFISSNQSSGCTNQNFIVDGGTR